MKRRIGRGERTKGRECVGGKMKGRDMREESNPKR